MNNFLLASDQLLPIIAALSELSLGTTGAVRKVASALHQAGFFTPGWLFYSGLAFLLRAGFFTPGWLFYSGLAHQMLEFANCSIISVNHVR